MTPPKLEPGSPEDEYPINVMGSEDFNVGGVRRTLPPLEQLKQLESYMDAHHPRPTEPEALDRWMGRLPDRLTHAAMIMLGTAVDHSMPGVAYAGDITVRDVPEVGARQFIPTNPTGAWAISFHSGGLGQELEFAWRPEVAAVAQLSGVIILDVDLHDASPNAISWARSHNPTALYGWGYKAGATIAAQHTFDKLALTFPEKDLGVDAFVQVPLGSSIPGTEYVATEWVSTPEVARARVLDVAKLFKE